MSHQVIFPKIKLDMTKQDKMTLDSLKINEMAQNDPKLTNQSTF